MPVWQPDAVHFVRKQRRRIHGLLQRNRVSVVIDAMKAHARAARKRCRLVKQIAQRQTFPDSVTDQARIQPVANAHQRRFLTGRRKSEEILESPGRPIPHHTVHFKAPKTNIHSRIDNVLGYAIKQIVRRDWLDDTPFVLRAVVTKGGHAIKCARESAPAASQCDSNRAQQKRASAHRRSEFLLFALDFWSCQKLKPSYERSLENKNTERKADEGNEPRNIDWQADVTTAQHRPEHDCGRNSRQNNKDADRQKHCVAVRTAPRHDAKKRSGSRAD